MGWLTAVLATGFAALVALVEPVTSAAPDGTTMTAAVLALALVAVVHAGQVLGLTTPRLVLVTATTRGRTAPVTTDRVTDPVHHPLRPRAPGTC